MEKEIWKDIPDTDGKYQVSNMGRVRSRCKKNEWRIRAFDYTKYGYAAVHFQYGKKNFRKYVHRLVADAFVPGYKEGLFVNHKNENKADNRASNLEWLTHKENVNYGKRNEHAAESLRAKKRLYFDVKIDKPSTEQDIAGEEWRDVVGYEGIYMVSNIGRVKTIKRVHINGGILRQWQTQSTNGKGLLNVNLCDANGNHHMTSVARIVAMAYCDGYSENFKVKHLDGDMLNNRANNLKWVSAQEIKGRAVVQMDLDGNVIAEYPSIASAERAIGRNVNGGVAQSCRGLQKTAYGYKWKFKNNNEKK